MSIEVKQLTINSTLQRNEPNDTQTTKPSDENKSVGVKWKENKSEPSCVDPEQIKAEVLAACKKLINQSLNSRRAR